MTFRLASLALLAGATALTPAHAQSQDPLDLGLIILSAGLESASAEATGTTVQVITADDIERTGETRVVDVLSRQPGVSVRSNGPIGANSSVFIRGVSQNSITVRVDGIDVSDPSGTQVAYDFGGLLTSDISRIEILRGSQSAIYGSGAVGGAVNIFTKRAEKDGFSGEAAVEYGAYETLKTGLTLAHRGARHDAALTLSTISSEGFSAADENDGNDEADGIEGQRLSFNGSYDVTDDVTLHLSGFTDQSTYDFDEASGGRVFDGSPDDTTEKDQWGTRLGVDFVTGPVDHSLEASYFEVERKLRGEATTGFGSTDNDFNYFGERREIRYQAGFDANAATRVVIGADRRVESYGTKHVLRSAFGVLPVSDEQISGVTGVFAEVTSALTEDIDLGLALRNDTHSEFGSFLTGRLSLAWRAADDLTLRFNAANGYRAPSPYELYDANAGNDDLTPETSTSVDIGIEKTFANSGYAGASLFYIEAEDIIDYSFDSFRYVQAEGLSIRQGAELFAGIDITEGVTLEGSYTWTDSYGSANLDSSSWSAAVPAQKLALGLTADLGARSRLTLTGLGETNRADGLDDYFVAGATFAYDINEMFETYLRVENLTDAQYQLAEGYGTSDRAAYFGIRAKF